MLSGHTFAICTKNEDYEASLELRKLYEVLTDPKSDLPHQKWTHQEASCR